LLNKSAGKKKKKWREKKMGERKWEKGEVGAVVKRCKKVHIQG